MKVNAILDALQLQCRRFYLSLINLAVGSLVAGQTMALVSGQFHGGSRHAVILAAAIVLAGGGGTEIHADVTDRPWKRIKLFLLLCTLCAKPYDSFISMWNCLIFWYVTYQHLIYSCYFILAEIPDLYESIHTSLHTDSILQPQDRYQVHTEKIATKEFLRHQSVN